MSHIMVPHSLTMYYSIDWCIEAQEPPGVIPGSRGKGLKLLSRFFLPQFVFCSAQLFPQIIVKFGFESSDRVDYKTVPGFNIWPWFVDVIEQNNIKLETLAERQSHCKMHT